MRLFVGNLAFSVVDAELRKHFEDQGFTPTDLRVMTDRETGRSRGFAFVSFSTADDANLAIQQLDGSMLGGRDLRLSIAHDRPERSDQGRAPAPRQQQAPRTQLPSSAQKYTPAQPAARQAEPAVEQRPVKSRQQYTAAPTDDWGSQNKGGDRRNDRRNDRAKGKRQRDEDGDDW